MFYVGMNRRSIPTQSSYSLAGYYPMRKSTTTLDPIFINTLIFKENKSIFIFISIDIVAIDAATVQNIKDALIREYEELDFEISISASHTHSSIAGILDTENPLKANLKDIFGSYDETVQTLIIQNCLISIETAMENMEEAHIAINQENLLAIGTDRYDTQNFATTKSLLIEVITLSRKALILNYACHPTILNASNTGISADYLRLLYQELDYDCIVFLPGASANISTRFTREDSSLASCNKLSHDLAKDIESKVFSGEESIAKLEVKHYTLSLKTKAFLDTHSLIEQQEQLKQELENSALSPTEHRLLYAQLEALRTRITLNDTFKNHQSIDLAYRIITLNQLRFVMIPAEVTSLLAKPINELDNTYLVSLSNDYLFYFADTDNYQHHRYESQSSFLAEGEAERLMTVIKKELTK